MVRGHTLAYQGNGTKVYMTIVDGFGIMLSRPKVCISNNRASFICIVY